MDLDIGAGAPEAPEIKSQLLIKDCVVGMCRRDYPLHASKITAERYASFTHINVSRRGMVSTVVDTGYAGGGDRGTPANDLLAIVRGFIDAAGECRETESPEFLRP